MDMVARVADAILKHLIAEQDYMMDLGNGLIRYDGHMNLAEVARVAIEAMREPTEAMADAGREKHGVWGFGATDAKLVFEAMINSALKEHEGEKK
jgi:hypothetical protein